MGKLYLTSEELKRFPTVWELNHLAKDISKDLWGLCQNDAGDLLFGESTHEWKLRVTLQEINILSAAKCGTKCPTDQILFFYGVEYSQRHKIDFDFIEISSYEEEMYAHFLATIIHEN